MTQSLKDNSLYADTRLGGTQRLVVGDPRDALMRVPDEIRLCVAFLGVEKNGVMEYAGTAFLTAVRFEGNPQLGGVYYLVTARHNVERQDLRDLHLRVNRRDGGSAVMRLPSLGSWLLPDNAADVAVLRWDVPEDSDLYPAPNSMYASDAVIEQERIGVGEELIVTGLFPPHSGSRRNIPIVRAGIIAAMPDEPLEDRGGEPYAVYLAELRSLGGLSGSPVFVRLDPHRAYNETRGGIGKYYLLGLIRGHWPSRPGDDVAFDTEAGAVNSGIAQVTPITDLIDILYEEDEVKARRKMEREARNRNPPVLD